MSLFLSLSLYIYICYIYIYMCTYARARRGAGPLGPGGRRQGAARGTVDFRNFIVFFVGPRPWYIEIRHRVKQTSTINLFGFETLKLKIED